MALRGLYGAFMRSEPIAAQAMPEQSGENDARFPYMSFSVSVAAAQGCFRSISKKEGVSRR